MKKWFIFLFFVCIMTSCMVFSVSAAEPDFPFEVDRDKYPYLIIGDNQGLTSYIFTETPLVINEDGYYRSAQKQYAFVTAFMDGDWVSEEFIDGENDDWMLLEGAAIIDSNYIPGMPSYKDSNKVEYPEFPSYNRSDYPYYFLYQESDGDYIFYISSKPFSKSQYANAYCVDVGANYVVYHFYDDIGWYLSGNSTTNDGGMCIPFDGNTMITSNHIDGYIPEDIGLLNSIGKLFTSALSWVGDVASTMVSNPILLLFLVLPIAFIGIGLFRRIKD